MTLSFDGDGVVGWRGFLAGSFVKKNLSCRKGPLRAGDRFVTGIPLRVVLPLVAIGGCARGFVLPVAFYEVAAGSFAFFRVVFWRAASAASWIVWALTIEEIRPGKRFSIS